MFNSQSEEILTKYFLLLLQNQRLQATISKNIWNQHGSVSHQNNEIFVMERISHIEKTMGLELKHKQQKIHELSSYIKQLQSSNQEILKEYEKICQEYKKLEETYKNNQYAPPNPPPSSRTFQQKQYHISLLEKQKQQLKQHITRLTNITIKQLQADIDIFNKQNQSYILSINNYRAEETKYKNQKIKYEQQIKKLSQYIKVSTHEKQQIRRECKSKADEKYNEMDKKYRKQIEKMIKKYTHAIQELKQQNESLERKYKQKDEAYVQILQELERKSKKLWEYDEQYDVYLNKMNSLSLEVQQIRQQNTKLKQQYENILKNEKSKYQGTLNKLVGESNKQKERIVAQFTNKIKQMEEMSMKQKKQSHKVLKMQVQSLSQQIQRITKQNEEKCKGLNEQKQNAIKQWKQLLGQMEKQKRIISSLQKQMQNYRKTNLLYSISQSQGQNRTSMSIEKEQLRIDDLQPYQPSQNRVISNERNEIHDNLKKQATPYNRIFRYNTSQSQAQQSKKIQKKNQMQSSLEVVHTRRQNNPRASQQMECQQCKECSLSKRKNSDQLLIRNTPRREQQNYLAQCLKQKQRIYHFQSLRSSSLENVKRSSIQHTLRSDFMSREDLHTKASFYPQNPSLNHLQSYKSQQLQRDSCNNINLNMGSKRKDQVHKKYQYMRTKTEQDFNKNYIETGGQDQKYFFQENIQENARPRSSYPNNVNAQNKLNEFQQNKRKRISSCNVSAYHPKSQAKDNETYTHRQREHKLMRSSSLNRVNYDTNLQEIQKYLSFDIISMKEAKQNGVISRSASNKILRQNVQQPQSQRLRTYGIQFSEKSQRDFLMQKINKINSYRGDNSSKQSKLSNFYKRTPNQIPNRINTMNSRVGENKLKMEKQNINAIIHRKCQYISER